MSTDEWLLFLDTTIAGAHYAEREAGADLSKLELGALLVLVREPSNQFDANAIRLDHMTQKYGYIPAVQAQWLAKLLDAGLIARAQVDHVDIVAHKVSIQLQVHRASFTRYAIRTGTVVAAG